MNNKGGNNAVSPERIGVIRDFFEQGAADEEKILFGFLGEERTPQEDIKLQKTCFALLETCPEMAPQITAVLNRTQRPVYSLLAMEEMRSSFAEDTRGVMGKEF